MRCIFFYLVPIVRLSQILTIIRGIGCDKTTRSLTLFATEFIWYLSWVRATLSKNYGTEPRISSFGTDPANLLVQTATTMCWCCWVWPTSSPSSTASTTAGGGRCPPTSSTMSSVRMFHANNALILYHPCQWSGSVVNGSGSLYSEYGSGFRYFKKNIVK